MNAEISESMQHSITPGKEVDMYYPGESTNEVQAFPTTVENRFFTSLPSLNFGSSNTLVFNPSEGTGDMVLTATIPAPVGSLYTNWALPRGWLYQFIDNIGIRIGGSSLYYFTGDQLAVANFEDCEDSGKKTTLFQLGGAELLAAADYVSEQNRTASIYIKCPWNSVSALQKSLPLPSDLLTQPIQYIITFKRAADVFFPLAGALAANLPTGFDNATLQYRQVHFADSSHQLARRVNMNEHALTYPLKRFQQTTFRTTVSAAAGQEQTINLTGFRSGSVKHINLWVLKVADGAGAPVNVGNGYNWTQPLGVRLSVNGLIYFDSRQASSQLWALCDLKTGGYVENTVLTDGGEGAAVATPQPAPWVHIPFAQTSEVLANENELAMGLPIANSVVNLALTLPEDGRYVVSASYEYVAALMFSRGTCEYVF